MGQPVFAVSARVLRKHMTLTGGVGAVLGMLNATTSGPPPATPLPATLAPRPPFCGANRLLYANRTLVDVCVFVCLFAWLFVLLPVFSHCFYKRKVLFIMRIK